MKDTLTFSTKDEFHCWLEEHASNSKGVWLLFGKAHGPTTLSAQEALEEALCYGWIDGQMKRIDATSYQKYFSPRRNNSNWSKKNQALVAKLEQQGRMTDAGRAKVEEAKHNGQWDKPKTFEITEEQITGLEAVLKTHALAYRNFMAMSPSVKKTYTRAFLDAKTEAGKERRLAWIIARLNQNLKPM